MTYTYAALSTAGSPRVDAMTEERYREQMVEWERALDHGLRAGERLGNYQDGHEGRADARPSCRVRPVWLLVDLDVTASEDLLPGVVAVAEADAIGVDSGSGLVHILHVDAVEHGSRAVDGRVAEDARLQG